METNQTVVPFTEVDVLPLEEEDEITKKYQKLTPIEQILHRPGMWIGGTTITDLTTYVFDEIANKIVQKPLVYVPGICKIVDEVISNALDHYIRLHQEDLKRPKKCTLPKIQHVDFISIDIHPETNSFSVYNTGDGIPIVIHSKHNVYVPELIFGHLFSGSNYDDTEERLTVGTNGLGVKLCNIFGIRFEIETVDSQQHKKYRQVFENHMSIIHPPEIEDYEGISFTRVTVYPDFEYFQMLGWTTDLIKILELRTYGVAMYTKGEVQIMFNGRNINCPSLEQFIHLFDDTEEIVVEQFNDNWEVGLCGSEDGYRHISFVNGSFTPKGGRHVDYIMNQVCKKLSEIIEKKKKITVPNATIKESLYVFVKATIDKPEFDSQSKETLTTKVAEFGSDCELTPAFIDKIVKTGIVERIVERHEFKEIKKQSRLTVKKKGKLYGIPKLEDANEAGGINSVKCTLILTEGDSAKAMAMAGMSVVGRDYYGVFPLKGKIINARDKQTSAKGREQISENTEFNYLKQILGLEIGKVYTNLNELRYGHVMIMTDQDVDGSHIKGLFMNWIATFWSSLLEMGFISSMSTPIIKAKKGKHTELAFYSIGQFLQWQEQHATEKGWKIKYYKGLGTSTAVEAKEYFTNLKKVDYIVSGEQSQEHLDLAFNGDRSDDRKQWLQNYNINNILDTSQTAVSFEDFIDLDFIHFSNYDLKRSIPHIADGLKPSQRKILYACFKRNLTEEIKVAQLAGYVSEHSGYHHGEMSLNTTIVGMAQNFVGTNNVNLLMPNGQFGTRITGGDDAASSRYIFTELNPVVSALFKDSDKQIITYLNDDGMMVEPSFYIPILPSILFNGSVGIGTGYSTEIPCFNPKDVANAFIAKMDNAEFPTIHPYYNGFTGQIIPLENGSYLTKGCYHIKDYKTIVITELPIGCWTNKYKDFLETLLVEHEIVPNVAAAKKKRVKSATPSSCQEIPRFLQSIRNESTESTVYFELEFVQGALTDLVKNNKMNGHVDCIEKELKLTSRLSLSNMHLFNEYEIIHKYVHVGEIMDEFYTIRMKYYIKRKEYLLHNLQNEIIVLEQKVRFLGCILDDTIVVYKKDTAELTALLENLEFLKLPTYSYLLSMPISSLTTDTFGNLQKVLEDKRIEYQMIELESIETTWKRDIQLFLEQYEKMLQAITRDASRSVASKPKKTSKKSSTTKSSKSSKSKA